MNLNSQKPVDAALPRHRRRCGLHYRRQSGRLDFLRPGGRRAEPCEPGQRARNGRGVRGRPAERRAGCGGAAPDHRRNARRTGADRQRHRRGPKGFRGATRGADRHRRRRIALGIAAPERQGADVQYRSDRGLDGQTLRTGRTAPGAAPGTHRITQPAGRQPGPADRRSAVLLGDRLPPARPAAGAAQRTCVPDGDHSVPPSRGTQGRCHDRRPASGDGAEHFRRFAAGAVAGELRSHRPRN